MALNVGELTATLSLNTRDYTKGFREAERSASTFENKFGGAIRAVTGILGGLSVVAAGGYMLKLAGDTEKTAGSFKVLLGSASAAAAMMEKLETFAAETPFEFPEIATAAKNLLALGIEAEKIPDTLKSLGDVAAGVNIPFGELADIYGKMNVQGRVFAEDINQLQGRGIPVVQELAKQFGVSTEEIRSMVEQGKIGFPEIEKAFKSLTGEGGKFNGMMKELSTTIPGLISTMKDNINKTLTIIGQQLVTTFDIKGIIKGVSDAFETFNKNVKEFGIAMAISKSISDEAKIAVVALAAAVGVSLVAAFYSVAEAIFLAMAPLIPWIAAGAAIAVLAVTIYGAWEENMFGIRDLVAGLVKDITTWWDNLGKDADSLTSFIGEVFSWAFGIVAKHLKIAINNWYKLFTAIKNVANMIKTGDFSMENFMQGMDRDFAGEMFDSIQNKAKSTWKSVSNDFTSNMTKAVDGTKKAFNVGFDKIMTDIFGSFKKAPTIPGLDTQQLNKSTKSVQQATTATKEQKKVLEDLDKKLRDIDAQYAVYGKSVDVAKEKTRLIKQAMVDLRVAGVDPTSASYKNLQTQLNAISMGGLTTALTTNLGLSTTQATALTAKFSELTNWLGLSNDAAATMAQTLTNGLANVSPNISNIITSFNSLQDSFKSFKTSMSSGGGGGGGLMGILGKAGQIGAIINGIKQLGSAIKNAWSSFSGSKAKKEFFASLEAQSAANLKTAKEMMQPYKDYAKSIRDFSKSSLINIRGEAEEMTSFIEGLSLTATAEAVSTRIRKYGRKKTIWGTLWHYSFDQAGADSAKAFLERFMEISQGLSSGVSSAFSTGIKAFLGGKSDWMTSLRDGIRDAIIDAITTAVMQATIIKGALGDLLGDLSAGLTAGEDVTDIIEQIGRTIPTVAKQLEQVLTPLRGAIASAFPDTEIPAMADGGIVSRPTMALIGEAGPEAVVPLSQMGTMGGGNQTIIIELDGRTIGRAAVQYMPREVRIKTGLAFT